MTRINTNVSSLVAQNRLQASSADLNTALNRLSTGLSVNRGADDPAGLIASEALRAEVTGLTSAISNTERTSQIVSTVDSALGQVSDLLNEVRGLVVEAANSGAISDEEIAANQLQIDSSLEAINRISQSTTFQGRKLLDGTLDFTSTISQASSVTDVSIEQAILGNIGRVDVSVEVSAAAEQASISVADSAFSVTPETTQSSALTFNTFTLEAGGDELQIAGDFTSIELIDDPGLDGTATAVLNDGKLTLTIDSGQPTFDQSIDALINAVRETGLGFSGFGSGVPATFAETATTGTQNGEFRVSRSDGADFVIEYTESGATDTSASYDQDSNTLTVDIGSDFTDGDLIDTETAIEGVATGLGFSFEAELVDEDGASLPTLFGETLVPAADLSASISNEEILQDDLVFQINGSDGAETFQFGAGTTAEQVAAAVNLVSDSTGVTADTSDGLTFTSSDYGSDALVNIEVISEGPAGGFAAALSSDRDTGSDIQARVNGTQASGRGNSFSINTASLDLSVSVEEGSSANFNFSITGGGARYQLGSGVRGSQQARIGIGSVSTGQLGGPAGRLYEIGSGQSSSLSNDVASAAQIVDEVISSISQTRGRLGAFQSTTLASNLNNLSNSRANLQEAESSIRDADFAQESANLTRAQILVQSGTNVLSLANQNPQSVLSLIR